MINLTFYADSPFDNRRITDQSLLSYSSDQVGRMRKTNPDGHLLDERIAATEEALESFKSFLSADLTAVANRKAAKMDKKNFRSVRLKETLEKIHAWTLTAKSAIPAAESKVFPNGRYAISRVGDDQLKSNLEAIVQGLQELGNAIPAETVSEASALITDWTEIHAMSEKSTAVALKARAEKHNAKSALSRQLYFNILEIVRFFPGDKKAIERYSVQSLLGFTKPRNQSGR